MKIAVLIKRVPDTATVFKITPDGKSADGGNPKYVMSPYDEHAVELAMKLKEAGGAEVIAVSVGSSETKDIFRSALAMGADSGLLVTGPGADALSSRGVSHALASALKALNADIVLAGKQAVDDDASQVPERVAELLGLPHMSVVTRFELAGANAVVEREIEGGKYVCEVPLPALFTADKALNTPRYPTLPNIMKAKKKPIVEKTLGDLGIAAETLASGLSVEALSLPRQQRLGRILEGEPQQQVGELVRILREQEKVL